MCIKTKCKFFVSAKNLALFQVVVEDACNNHITIETDLEEEHAAKLLKTLEDIYKNVELFKTVEKIK